MHVAFSLRGWAELYRGIHLKSLQGHMLENEICRISWYEQAYNSIISLEGLVITVMHWLPLYLFSQLTIFAFHSNFEVIFKARNIFSPY